MKKVILFLLVSTLACAEEDTSDKIGNTINEVGNIAQTIQKDAKREIRISMNLIPGQLNRSVDNPNAEPLIDDSAQHFEVAVLFKANKKDPLLLAKSTHAYFSLHKLSYINAGESDSYWADHTDSLAFVYGHRYYMDDNYQGLGYGWYAGLSSWSNSDAYYWYSASGTVYSDYTDSGVSALAAGEFFYSFEVKNVFIAPRIILSIDTETGELLFAPQVMAGVKF